MRKKFVGAVVVLMVVFLSAGLDLAGNGKGPGNGTGPIHDILSGTPFEYTGDVVSLVPGAGMLIATDQGNVTIYGIGPVRYWEREEVERPAVGESVTVHGYTVDYSGVDRNIAMSITVGEQTIELRDPESGIPLWR